MPHVPTDELSAERIEAGITAAKWRGFLSVGKWTAAILAAAVPAALALWAAQEAPEEPKPRVVVVEKVEHCTGWGPWKECD